MESRDYLEKQIDQLGKVLGKILGDVLKLKSDGRFEEATEEATVGMNDALNLDLSELLTTKSEELIPFLLGKEGVKAVHLPYIAEILQEIAESLEASENSKSTDYYKKSLLLHEYVASTEANYSFDRHFKIQRIKIALQRQDHRRE